MTMHRHEGTGSRKRGWFGGLVGLLPLVVLVAGLPFLAGADCGANAGTEAQKQEQVQAEPGKTVAPEKQEAVSASVQDEVDHRVDERVDDKRDRIMKEAVSAVEDTRKALQALEDDEKQKALDALERVVGKLELILAREPTLALAPVNVGAAAFDVLTSLDTIEKARDAAEEALEEGDVQRARRLVGKMASEIVVSVSSIPLATYPAAIKAVAPLIDAGKIDEAKRALRAALNTLVVTDHVIPLPNLRAEAMLKEAEKLAEKEDRSQEQNERLAELLQNARYQLEMGQALGYGGEDAYRELYRQLEGIEKKTGGGKSGEGFFDQLNQSLGEMIESVFRKNEPVKK